MWLEGKLDQNTFGSDDQRIEADIDLREREAALAEREHRIAHDEADA